MFYWYSSWIGFVLVRKGLILDGRLKIIFKILFGSEIIDTRMVVVYGDYVVLLMMVFRQLLDILVTITLESVI